MRKTGRAALARLADKLWGQIVRAKGCCEECVSAHASPAGPIQAAHGFSRRYRSTRWLPINGFALCAGCHVFYTHRPLEWDQRLRELWGEPVYTELRYLALGGKPVDLEATVQKLREELAKVSA